MNRVNFHSRSFRLVTHVIFDLDGLLLDTETLYTVATQNIVDRWGKTYDWSVKEQVMGLPGKAAAQKLIELMELPCTVEEYQKLASEQYSAMMPEAKLMPDTEKVYKKAISDIAKKHGKIYTPDIMAKVVGTPELESSRIAVEEMKLPMNPKDFLKQFKSLTSQQFSRRVVPFMPGAERLINHLSSNNIPIAVATSSSFESFCLKTKKHRDLFDLFDHVVTGGSDPAVKRGKPSPDIFLVCASRFMPPAEPNDCLVFEDAPNGVRAGIDAGMQVVMVPDKQTSPELCKDATMQLSSLEDIQLELFGLPPLT